MPEWWQKRSSPPPCGRMKPKPFSAFQLRTTPPARRGAEEEEEAAPAAPAVPAAVVAIYIAYLWPKVVRGLCV